MTTMIGELLIRQNVITRDDLKRAIEYQKRTGGRIGEALVALDVLTQEQMLSFFRERPAIPRSVDETGLPITFLTDLLLKIAYYEGGVFTLLEMAGKLLLSGVVVEEIVGSAKANRLIAIRAAGTANYATSAILYELTEQGRQRALSALETSQYIGPAPVPLDDYYHLVAHQSIRQIDLDAEWIRDALKHMVVAPILLDQLGPAFSSGRSIFLYGPPGTGKSSISEALARGIGGSVFIPHGVMVDGLVIRVFDPEIHIPVSDASEENSESQLDTSKRHDPRWVYSRRPVVMVGGELTLELLDLDFNEISKTYEAPVHMKANNGVFILDDFGRQQVQPRQLLNRWIVPLERSTDFLTLHTGKKFEIPFDQISVFCTNLKPSELVDEAFLRRIRHKVKIGHQSETDFREVLSRVCAAEGVPFDPSAAEYLVDRYYRAASRPFVGSHPRDLVDQIVDHARFTHIRPELTRESIDVAAANYFVEL